MTVAAGQPVASFYVAVCPLGACAWRSEPLTTEPMTVEALRAHVATHPQGELVDHVVNKAMHFDRYDRTTS